LSRIGIKHTLWIILKISKNLATPIIGTNEADGRVAEIGILFFDHIYQQANASKL
jgi:hypothetical protein